MRYLLILTLIISSCTITKRVHRSGWHVEWKKNYSSQSKNHESNKTTRLESSKNETVQIIAKSENLSLENLENQQQSSQLRIDNKQLDKEFEETIASSDEMSQIEALSIQEKSSKSQSRLLKKSMRPARDQIMTGLVLLVLGLLGISLSLILYFSASSSIDTVSALVWYTGSAITGVLGIVLFVAGLIFLITQGVAKNEERINGSSTTNSQEKEPKKPKSELHPNNDRIANATAISIVAIAVLLLILIYA